MACPAGFTEKDLHLLQNGEHPAISNKGRDLEKAEHGEYPFRRICEPEILRKEIMPEPVMFLASEYSILMQWCKYGLARGSLEHSDFAQRVLRRLITTTRYLTSVVYGTEEQRANIASVIHRYHAVVKQEKDDQGEAYYADDPELHRWTAATLFVGFYDVYKLFFGPMTTAKKTQLMKECSIFGTGLRMPPEMWFDNLDDFYAYWNHNVDTLEVTHWARELANSLLHPPMHGIQKILYPGSIPVAHYMRIMTIHLLPPRIRQGYGLKIGFRRQTLYDIYFPATLLAVKLTPRFIRHALFKPVTLWDMKHASKKIEKTGKW